MPDGLSKSEISAQILQGHEESENGKSPISVEKINAARDLNELYALYIKVAPNELPEHLSLLSQDQLQQDLLLLRQLDQKMQSFPRYLDIKPDLDFNIQKSIRAREALLRAKRD